MSGLGCSRKGEEGKEKQGWGGGGEEKKLLTYRKKKLEYGGGDDGVRGRFMEDVYYYTALPPGKWGKRGGIERQTFPFPFLFFFAYTGAMQGGGSGEVESFVSNC